MFPSLSGWTVEADGVCPVPACLDLRLLQQGLDKGLMRYFILGIKRKSVTHNLEIPGSKVETMAKGIQHALR